MATVITNGSFVETEHTTVYTGLTSLPCLAALVDECCLTDKEQKVSLLLITHLLPTSIDYIKCLSGIFDIDVIGIPYSSTEEVVKKLKCLLPRVRVTLPGSIYEIPEKALAIMSRFESHQQQFIIQEVGGYLAEYAKTLNGYSKLLGIVEDTNNGHWKYESITHQLSFPVISISKSPIKAIEDIQIGPAVAFSVERLLREELYTTYSDKVVFIIGFGSIGSSCAQAFRDRGCRVIVYDTDKLKSMMAKVRNFQIGQLEESLAKADIVIGATGKCSISLGASYSIKQGALIVSASSKQVEFDIPGFQEHYQVRHFSTAIQQYSCPGRYFFVGYNGCPINFRDNSILGCILDGIYSELFLCLRELSRKHAEKGLQKSWNLLHQEVAEMWHKAYL